MNLYEEEDFAKVVQQLRDTGIEGEIFPYDPNEALLHTPDGQKIPNYKIGVRVPDSIISYEYVYTPGGVIVGGEFQGTFNISDPSINTGTYLFHGVDIAPWLLWGSSPDDPTTQAQRTNMLINGIDPEIS